ncbi:uncharacterized protein LOC118737746 [Rhagoletis pomonella]|uniref:uncharacterized protein LOC118737746 n=1 Tax=Rhagoletis pomonella TaxID=28610 RepID=UPI001786B2D5|nr:uncharacterized protein LOC118737746 [Rhagoletis pomonella]
MSAKSNILKHAMRRSNMKKWVERPRRIEKVWTTEESRKLVEFIGSREAIWDFSSVLYKNREVRHKIWVDIAMFTNHSVNDAKNYWNNLRSRFNTERKKALAYESLHPGSKFESTFELYLPMQFLTKSEAHKLKGNVKEENLHSETKSNTSLANPLQDDSDLEYIISSDDSNIMGNNYASLMMRDGDNCAIDNEQTLNNEIVLKQCTQLLPENEASDLENFTSDPLSSVPPVKSFTNRPQELHTNRRWKEVFSEFVLCELDRYEYNDAQRLKTQLAQVCLNFEPTNE